MMKKFFILSAICALMCSCGSQKKVEGNTADLYGEWIIEKAMGLSRRWRKTGVHQVCS